MESGTSTGKPVCRAQGDVAHDELASAVVPTPIRGDPCVCGINLRNFERMGKPCGGWSRIAS